MGFGVHSELREGGGGGVPVATLEFPGVQQQRNRTAGERKKTKKQRKITPSIQLSVELTQQENIYIYFFQIRDRLRKNKLGAGKGVFVSKRRRDSLTFFLETHRAVGLSLSLSRPRKKTRKEKNQTE